MRLMRLGCWTLAGCWLLLTGCSTTPSVMTDYDSDFSFGQLETFRVEQTQQDDGNDLLISPFTLGHLKSVLEEQLSSRYEVSSDNPDFLVRYHIVVEDRLDVRPYDHRYGFGYYGYGPWHRYPYPPSPNQQVYRQGTLIIDISRAEDDKPLWRGVSEQRLYDRLSPREQRQRLSAAVTEIMANFPPVK